MTQRTPPEPPARLYKYRDTGKFTEAIFKERKLFFAAPWMLRKADHWSYEKEWRVLDFETGPGAKPFPPSCLTGVILGCRVPADEEAKVREWIQGWPAEVHLYRARQSRASFRLEINRES